MNKTSNTHKNGNNANTVLYSVFILILKILLKLVKNYVFWLNIFPAIYLTSQCPIKSIFFVVGCINCICVVLIIKDEVRSLN